MEISFKQTLFSIDPKNKRCNDCGDKSVEYVSVNNGITLCELCAEIHKKLGRQVSFVRKIDDDFDDYLANYFIYGGNKKFSKKLKSLGVNLDMQKSKLYKTYGADYYRRNLKVKVDGNGDEEDLKIDFDNASTVMKESEIPFNYPELEKYRDITKKKKNKENIDINNDEEDNEDQDDSDNIKNNEDDNRINLNEGNTKINTNNKNINNNKDNEDVLGKDNLLLNNPNIFGNPNEDFKKAEIEGNSTGNKNVKNIVNFSLRKLKTVGAFVRKESIKGYGAIKKAGGIIAKKSLPATNKIKSTAKSTANYVGKHMPKISMKKISLPHFSHKNNNGSNKTKFNNDNAQQLEFK